LDEPPIWEAVRRGRANVVRLLLERGADPNHVWPMGATLLHLAANTGNREIVQILIEAGMDINAPDNDGRTPLHVTVSGFAITKFGFRHNDVLTLLVEHGADLYKRDKNGEAPLDLARRWEIAEAVTILERLQREHPEKVKER